MSFRASLRMLLLGLLVGVIVPADAADASFLARYAETNRFRLGRPTKATGTPDGKEILFLRSGPRDFVQDLYRLNLKNGREQPLVTADQLLGGEDETLSVEEKARRERSRTTSRGIAGFHLSPDGKQLLVPLSGRLFLVERKSRKFRELTGDGGSPVDPRFSPDGTMLAVVRDGDLFVIDLATGTQRRLTEGAGKDGDAHISFGLSEFVAQEEMSRHHGYWWSPDSRRIAYQRTDTSGLEQMTIGDATHPESSPNSWPYPRPGKPNAVVTVGVLTLEDRRTTWVEWDNEQHEYLAAVTWSKNAPLTLLVQNRTQTEQQLLAVNDDGSTRTLLVESDPAWLDLDETMPIWFPDGSGFLWTTERRGAWQLEARDRDGAFVHEVTPVEFGLDRVARVDFEKGYAIVTASTNPTERHVYRVTLDGKTHGVTALTTEAGVHFASKAGEGPLWLLMSNAIGQGTDYRVMNGSDASGRSLTSVAESPDLEVNLELREVGSSRTYHTALIRPGAFDPEHKYPIIVHVYGGPTSQMVRAQTGRYVLDQWMADQGYIVVAIDGRGTPGRGREWHRVVKHDLIEIPLHDQAEALQLLAAEVPQMDLERVGIYGWSFGGYFSALAVMRRPEVFHAGVAGAPVVDWRDYDTHYTERYMDTPQNNPDGYDAANVLTYAGDLSRPLLIIHGTADDNVYFSHSLKLADRLFREGRPFDFLPLPGFTHMVPDPLVTKRLYGRIMDHFADALREQVAAD
ncbi:MAG: S9 family peptidase [Acidobacteriota bacterium]|nr:S9 family peptidase [Acidobacteriota bacterium]MDH3785153.1 S9 family peptidase [Acidobacteriota bacterium]